MKYLLPVLREKKRYMVFKTHSDSNLNFKDLKETIIDSYKELFGIIGLAKAGIQFIDYTGDKGILRVNNKCTDNVRASFCNAKKVNKQEVILRTIGVSGILKKAKNKFANGGAS